jgi:hypothetical protein
MRSQQNVYSHFVLKNISSLVSFRHAITQLVRHWLLDAQPRDLSRCVIPEVRGRPVHAAHYHIPEE